MSLIVSSIASPNVDGGIGASDTSFIRQGIIQTKYERSDDKIVFSTPTSGDGISIPELSVTFRPVSPDSKIILTWMINCEIHHDVVFLVHENRKLIDDPEAPSWNMKAGNQRWSGIVAAQYENNPNYDSTPNNMYMQFVVDSKDTNVRSYMPAVRSSSGTARTFALNRTIGSSGANGYENMISTVTAMEIMS